jgi:hypothetical protein
MAWTQQSCLRPPNWPISTDRRRVLARWSISATVLEAAARSRFLAQAMLIQRHSGRTRIIVKSADDRRSFAQELRIDGNPDGCVG